jgi:GntR family transcriptional repressor for pyruvate dehydrogenase complex
MEATRTEGITRELREEVLRGRYRPGERLPSERELAARFQTTRGVARVALKKLEQLGLATVLPGGARVRPVREASLDVIGHLLELEQPPPPELVDQVLEVIGALLASTVRMTLERAQPEQLARAEVLVERLRQPDVGDEERHRLLHEFAHAMMDANDNVVMHMVGRCLHTELFPSLHGMRRVLGDGERGPLRAGRPLGGLLEIGPYADELAGAVKVRDGRAAAEVVHQMWSLLRRNVRRALETARVQS